MKRSPLKPSTKPLARAPFRSRPKEPGAVLMLPAEPKPAPGPRKRKCAVCRESFAPITPWAKACKPECAHALVERTKAQQKAKAARQERAQDKIKLEGMKTYPQLIREAQRAFNEAVRWRDRLAGHACISSGRALDWSGNAVDAGHYRSVGSAPNQRFNFDNCHAQSKHDNQYKAGNAVDYRIGLIARIGLARVEALEADNTPRKWTHDELRTMKAEFQRMVRELKKEN